MPFSRFGLNPAMHLVPQALDAPHIARQSMRDGFGVGLVEAGKKDERIVTLCADLTESTRCLPFKEAFPNRFIQVGVSEQSLASLAAGMALCGDIPFIASYAIFSPGRNWEQIRTGIALQHANVKIIGSHAGISVGPDGATHQMLEDIALLRVLPQMMVVVPCDSEEARKTTLEMATDTGPAYLRLSRHTTPVFTTPKTPFRLGKAEVFRFGKDVTLIACGPLLYEALLAADLLSKTKQIEALVLNVHTVKPLDEKTILEAAKKTGCVVTIEEAQCVGGLGGAVAELLGDEFPVPLERMGVQDFFGESGEADALLEAHGLYHSNIARVALRAIARAQGKRVPPSSTHRTHLRADLDKARETYLQKALGRTSLT